MGDVFGVCLHRLAALVATTHVHASRFDPARVSNDSLCRSDGLSAHAAIISSAASFTLPLSGNTVRPRRVASGEAAPQTEPETTNNPESEPPRRHHSGKLSRTRLEAYFRHEKTWLDPACKNADLVFDVNSAALSGFINRTYGMNFNRYLNRWRLRELERLRTQPSNRGKSMRSLVEKVGFDNYRTYLRAVAAEREADAEATKKASGHFHRRGHRRLVG